MISANIWKCPHPLSLKIPELNESNPADIWSQDLSTWLEQNLFVCLFFVYRSLLFTDHKSTLFLKYSTAIKCLILDKKNVLILVKNKNKTKQTNKKRTCNLVCFIQLSFRFKKKKVKKSCGTWKCDLTFEWRQCWTVSKPGGKPEKDNFTQCCVPILAKQWD